MSPTGSEDGETVARAQASSPSAAPRRGRIGEVEEYEEKIANVAAGKGDEFSVGMGVKERPTEEGEMLQLMRGLMGRLDRLENHKAKFKDGFLEGDV